MKRHLISLGWRCDTAFQLRMHGGENVAHFFDWLATPVAGLLRILEADFDVFHPEGLVLRTDLTPHSVEDLPTGVLFHHQFPLYAGHMQPDFLLHYPAFIQKFRYLAARFRAYVSEKPVTLVRQHISRDEALRLEEIVAARYPGADLRFLYLNPDGEVFETPLGRAHLLQPGGSLGIPSEWIRVLQAEGLIDAPYRHATAEILGAAHDDHNLSYDNRFSEEQLQEAVAANPQKAEFRLELARWYAARNRWANAEEQALIALIHAPHLPAARYAAIQAQWRCGHLGAAEAAAEIVPLLAEGEPPAEWLAEAAAMLLAAERPEDALTQARRALAAAPAEQRFYLQQAECLYRLRQHEALALTLETAKRLRDLPPHYEHILAITYEALGKFEQALAASQRAVAGNFRFNHAYTLAGLLARFGQYDEALELCEKTRPVAGQYLDALEKRAQEIVANKLQNDNVTLIKSKINNAEGVLQAPISKQNAPGAIQPKLGTYKIQYTDVVRESLTKAGDSERILFKDVDHAYEVPLRYAGFGEKNTIENDATLMDRFDETGTYFVPEPRIYLLRDAIVRTQYGVVTMDDFAIRESLFCFPWSQFSAFEAEGPRFQETACTFLADDPVLTISDAYSAHAGIQENYYHWLILFLAKVNQKFLNEWEDERHAMPALLLPYFLNDVQRESARAIADHYGLSIINTTTPTSIKVDRLVYPQPLRAGGLRPHPMIKETFEILRNKFYKKGDYPEKIYISRRDTNNRKLLNEAEIEKFLQERGFVPIMLTGLSLAEQINLFAHAKTVIAPHGAGLTNIAFCEPETKILEIHMPSYLNWCYRRLSAVLNLRYGFLFGDLVEDFQKKPHGRSFLLNLNSFEKYFDAVFLC